MSGRSGVKPIRDDVAKILSAYVKGNAVAPDELPALIAQVGALLYGLKPVAPAPPIPAVPVRQSVLPDAVVCLDCGWQGKILRGHIRAVHGLSAGAYRERWGLRADHPLVAPSYSKRRSVLALSLGLGRRAADRKQATADAVKKRARQGRPRPSRLDAAG